MSQMPTTDRIVRFSEYTWQKLVLDNNPDYKFHAYELTTNSTLVEAILTYPPLDKASSSALPDQVKLRRLKASKPGTWYDDWKPYCGMCSTFARMIQMPYGFKCSSCRNDIGWDLIRLTDSDYTGKR